MPANDNIHDTDPPQIYQPLDFHATYDSQSSQVVSQLISQDFGIERTIDNYQNMQLENDENLISTKDQQIQMIDKTQIQRSKTKCFNGVSNTNNLNVESPSKNQQLSKNDQRRQNLRKRRSREQLVQVVDAFIREATVFTVYQSYVEANFINDMMNLRDAIVDSSVRWGLQVVIKEVMSEIFIANEVSQVLQAVLTREARYISYECLQEHTLLTEIESSTVKKESPQKQKKFVELNWHCDFYESVIENVMKSIIVDISQLEFMQQNQLLEQQRLKDQQLENISEITVNNMLDIIVQGQIIDKVKVIEVENHKAKQVLMIIVDSLIDKSLIEQILDENITHQILNEDLADQLMINVLFEETKILAMNQFEIVRIEEQQQLRLIQDYQQIETDSMMNMIQEIFYECQAQQAENNNIDQLTSQVFEDVLYSEALEIVINEVEGESLANDQVTHLIDNQSMVLLKSTYDENVALDSVMKQMMSQIMIDMFMENMYTQNDIYNDFPKLIQSQIIEDHAIQECFEVAQDSICIHQQLIIYDKIEHSITQALVNETIDHSLIVDEIFESIISQLIHKEVAFQLQLEKDSQMFANSLFDNCFNDFTSSNVLGQILPITIQESIVQDQVLDEIRDVSHQMCGLGETGEDLMTELSYQMILEILVETANDQQQQQNKIVQERELENKAINFYHQQFLNRFLKNWLRQIADDLILKLITESIYKRTMSKIIKRNVYNIIQSSVEAISNLEEDTITIANTILSDFIQKEIDSIICQEIVATQDALTVQDMLLSNFLEKEVIRVITQTINQLNLYNGKKNVQSSLLNSRQYQLLNLDENECSINIRGSDLIRIDNHSSDHEDDDASANSGDADVFSDQDEGASYQNTHTPHDFSIMSPSTKPDFHRNILSNSKSVSSSLQKYHHQPRPSDIRQKTYPTFFEKTQKQSNSNIFRMMNPLIQLQPRTNNSHNRSGSSEIEIKAIKFTLNTSATGYNTKAGCYSQKRNSQIRQSKARLLQQEDDNSPTVRYPQNYLNDRYHTIISSQLQEQHPMIRISQDVGGSSVDQQNSSIESYHSTMNSCSKYKSGKKSQNSIIIQPHILTEQHQMSIQRYHQRSISHSKLSLTSKNLKVILAKSSMLGSDEDDKMCTVESDEDEGEVFKCDEELVEIGYDKLGRCIKRGLNTNQTDVSMNRAINNNTYKYQNTVSNKRVANVLAQEPKEGIKFIESKVQSTIQSQKSFQNLDNIYNKKNVPVKTISVELSQNNSYYNQEPVIETRIKEKCSTNQSKVISQNQIENHQNDSSEFYHKYLKPNADSIQSIRYQYQKSKTQSETDSESANFNTRDNIPTILSQKKIEFRKHLDRGQGYIEQRTTSQTPSLTSEIIQVTQINYQLEKLLISIQAKNQEIKKSTTRSSQLATIDFLIRMAQQIISCNDIDQLFEIDQQLKDCLIRLSTSQKHQQEIFSVVLLTNQLALLNYQKLSCLVEKKTAHNTQIHKQTLKSLNNMYNKKTSSSDMKNHQLPLQIQHLQSQQLLSQQKNQKSREDLSNLKNTYTCNSNNSLISTKMSSKLPRPQQNMNVQQTSNYFSNNSESVQKPNGLQAIDMKMFKFKDQQFILKCIGKLDSNGHIPCSAILNKPETNNGSLSCQDFQKRQFYLMTLYHVMRQRVRDTYQKGRRQNQGEEIMSIDDLFNKAKVEKVHQKDWKEYIAKNLEILEQ